MHGLAFLVLLLHQLGIVRWNELEDQLGQHRLQLLLQYCAYVVIVCSFHLAEFFTTAIYNPTVLTANAYIISQSPAYTLAAFVSKANTKRLLDDLLTVSDLWTVGIH